MYPSSLGDSLTLKEFQRQHREWQLYNFPNQTLEQSALGVCEEAGELAHGVLKMVQGIRGTNEEHRMEIFDAAGDLMAFLAGVADEAGFELQDALEVTWAKVKNRDWKKDPLTGGE